MLGFAPLPVPPVVVAATRQELRLAVFRRDGRGYELREYHAVPLPAGVFSGGALGGPVADAEALASCVRALLGRSAGRISRASLVLPDAWARGMTVELESALPDAPTQALEVLRFRMRKLVPFRIEELRLAAVPIERLTGQEGGLRALVLLAAENVCAGLESAFAGHGVRLGQVTNSTLARLGGLAREQRLPGLAALASVEPEGFTLVFARDGAPVLWRQKVFTEELLDDDRARLLGAELRLTRTFLAERLAGEGLTAALLSAPAEVEGFWMGVLEEGLAHSVASLQTAHLPLTGASAAAPAAVLAPLVGAACLEIAA